MGLYVLYIYTPSAYHKDGTDRKIPGRKVRTYWVGTKRMGDMLVQEWNEFRRFAHRFPNKIEAKKIQSKLRLLMGSETVKIIGLDRYRYSKKE